MSKVGDWLDARDNMGNWQVAQVVSVGRETLRILVPFKIEENILFESPKVSEGVSQFVVEEPRSPPGATI